MKGSLNVYVDKILTFFTTYLPTHLLEVFWGQPIKLIHVVSTSEFHEYWWNVVDFIFFIPSI